MTIRRAATNGSVTIAVITRLGFGVSVTLAHQKQSDGRQGLEDLRVRTVARLPTVNTDAGEKLRGWRRRGADCAKQKKKLRQVQSADTPTAVI